MSDTFSEDDERCSDPIDEACKLEQRMTQNDVAKARALSRPEQVPTVDVDGVKTWPITECVDCDDDIPQARLELGRVRCVTCQGILERKRSMYGA